MDSNFKARLGLELKKGELKRVKEEIQNSLQINLNINASGTNSTDSKVKSLITEIDKLNAKIDSMKTKQQQSHNSNIKGYDTEITKIKQLSTWKTRLEKMQISSPKAFIGDTDESKKVVEGYQKMTNAMKTYEQQATKMNSTQGKVAMDELSVSLKKATQNTFSLGNMLEIAVKKFLAWMSVTQVAMKVLQAIQLMVTNVIELDTAMVELAKVTDMTDEALQSFTEKAFEASSQLGRTGKEFIEASAEFKRSGYTIKESFDLANEALLMMNIGDGINDTETAVSTLISTLKAYNLEATDARKVNDLINQVSNNSAISFDKLAEGIRRTGAVYAQSGTSIEELSGLLTGTNEIMQNIEKSSSGLIEDKVVSKYSNILKKTGLIDWKSLRA